MKTMDDKLEIPLHPSTEAEPSFEYTYTAIFVDSIIIIALHLPAIILWYIYADQLVELHPAWIPFLLLAGDILSLLFIREEIRLTKTNRNIDIFHATATTGWLRPVLRAYLPFLALSSACMFLAMWQRGIFKGLEAFYNYWICAKYLFANRFHQNLFALYWESPLYYYIVFFHAAVLVPILAELVFHGLGKMARYHGEIPDEKLSDLDMSILFYRFLTLVGWKHGRDGCFEDMTRILLNSFMLMLFTLALGNWVYIFLFGTTLYVIRLRTGSIYCCIGVSIFHHLLVLGMASYCQNTALSIVSHFSFFEIPIAHPAQKQPRQPPWSTRGRLSNEFQWEAGFYSPWYWGRCPPRSRRTPDR